MWFSVTSPFLSFPASLCFLLSSILHLFLDLKDEEAQVDVFGSQQLVALDAVTDGQRRVLRLVGVVGEDVVLDDGFNLHVIVRALEQQEGTLQRRVYLALQDQLEGECALTGEVGVALGVVDTRLQHPRLVEHGEARCLVVQPGDEVVCAVRPKLHLYTQTKWIFSIQYCHTHKVNI